MGWIVQIALWVLGLFLKKEPPIAQEAKEAGSLDASLKDMETTNEAVAKADVAHDVAERSASTDGGLRKYEAADPNNRDTAK